MPHIKQITNDRPIAMLGMRIFANDSPYPRGYKSYGYLY